jgi:hypothetical protein
MLSTSQLREEVEAIVGLVIQGKIEDAKQRLNHLAPDVSSEYGRGALLALNGILNVIENKSVDKMADAQKILRAAERIPKIQTTDDMDRGYLQTISKWAKAKPVPKDSVNAAQA